MNKGLFLINSFFYFFLFYGQFSFAKNIDLENFCKDYAKAKNLQLNLFPPELIYEVYDECLIKGLKWMRKYEKNKSSKKKSLEQIMIETEQRKREARERDQILREYMKKKYENSFENYFQ